MASPDTGAVVLRQRPTVTATSWRVDVILSSDALRAPRHNAQPIAVVNMALSDGRVVALRLRPEELHQWRYTLAKAVKDMAFLERKRPPAATAKGRKASVKQ